MSLEPWSPQQLQEAVILIASSTLKRAVIVWPGDHADIRRSFAAHSLHLHTAASNFIAQAVPSLPQVFVFDRWLSSFAQHDEHPDNHDISFVGPTIMDAAHNSPHFLPPNQPLEPLEVSVMRWPPSLEGLVTVQLDGAMLAEVPFRGEEFDTAVPLPHSLSSGTHTIVLCAIAGSHIVAQSSVTIVIAGPPLSKWPGGAPSPAVSNQAPLQPPPQTIPDNLLAEFTMNHSADVDYM